MDKVGHRHATAAESRERGEDVTAWNTRSEGEDKGKDRWMDMRKIQRIMPRHATP